MSGGVTAADRSGGEHGYSGEDVGQQLARGVAGVSVEEWARGIDESCSEVVEFLLGGGTDQGRAAAVKRGSSETVAREQ